MARKQPNWHGRNIAPDDETCHARFPHPNHLPQAGEGANESLREFQVKARRRIHRAFLKWMQENRHRFLVPVNIRHRTDQGIELTFAGYHPAISAWLSNRCIDVPVNWQGQCWDLLCSFESAPSPVTGGYHCLLYSPEDRQIFSSREALWATEVFELFLKWVNETLAPANWFALYDFGSMTMAKLYIAQPEACADLVALLPCRWERGKDTHSVKML